MDTTRRAGTAAFCSGALALAVAGGIAGGIAAGIAAAAPAAASCAAPPVGYAGTAYVFVGTVLDVGASGRDATVRVEQVWRGSVPAGTVEVHGGPDLAAVTSVDRTYTAGARYVFAPFQRDGRRFLDNACSATSPYTAAVRPRSAGVPAVGPASGAGSDVSVVPLSERRAAPAGGWPWAPVGAGAGSAVLAAGLAGLLLRRRRRRGQRAS